MSEEVRETLTYPFVKYSICTGTLLVKDRSKRTGTLLYKYDLHVCYIVHAIK